MSGISTFFELGEAGDGHALKYLGLEVLHRYDLLNKFKVVIESIKLV